MKRQPAHHKENGMHGELGWVPMQPIRVGAVTHVRSIGCITRGLTSLHCKTSGTVFQALRVWKRGSKMGQLNFDNMVPVRTGVLCPVAVVPTGILHPSTGYIFFL